MITSHFPIGKSPFQLFGGIGYGTSFLLSGTTEIINLNGDDPVAISRTNIFDDQWYSRWIKRWDHGLYSNIGLIYSIKSGQT